jgi:hypothetical protein
MASTRVRAMRKGQDVWRSHSSSFARTESGRRAGRLNAVRISKRWGRHFWHAKTPGPHRGFWPSVQETTGTRTSRTLDATPAFALALSLRVPNPGLNRASQAKNRLLNAFWTLGPRGQFSSLRWRSARDCQSSPCS